LPKEFDRTIPYRVPAALGVLFSHASTIPAHTDWRSNMEQTSTILTVKDIAEILRCSKTHVGNVMNGKVPGIPRLAHLTMGRRKLVRKEWLDRWLETNKVA